MRRRLLLRILYFVMYHPAKSTGIHLHIFDGNATIAQDNQTLHDMSIFVNRSSIPNSQSPAYGTKQTVHVYWFGDKIYGALLHCEHGTVCTVIM